MKNTIILFFLSSVLATTAMNAQSYYGENSLSPRDFTPHLVDANKSIELGIGWEQSKDALSISLGYNVTNRFNVLLDFSTNVKEGFNPGNYFSLLASLHHVYEAVPSIRGGFYFSYGLSIGMVNTGYYYYDDNYGSYQEKMNIIPYIGPSISCKHHLFDWLAVGARASSNILPLFENSDSRDYKYDGAEFMVTPFLLFLF